MLDSFQTSKSEHMTNKVAKLNKLLPFVAIGTIADAQSVVEPTNRLLIKSGIHVLNNSKLFFGLEDLIEKLGIREKMLSGYQIDSQDLAFLLSPILNASGRIAHAKLSIQTLINTNYNQTENLATKLIQVNTDRKNLVKEYLENINLEVDQQLNQNKKLIWLVGDWNKGIVGLMASRILNQTNLPVAVLSISESEVTGSFRAPNGYNLPEALNKCSDLLIKFGGHPQAAGFTAKLENVSQLAESLEKVFSASLDLSRVDPNQLKQINLNIQDISSLFFAKILILDPFGIDFPVPTILLKAKDLEKYDKKDMSGGKHIKMTVKDVDIIFFNLETTLKEQLIGGKFSQNTNLEFNIGKNFWNGKLSYQLIFQRVNNLSIQA